jgi:suppressor for copper-sensitivity B
MDRTRRARSLVLAAVLALLAAPLASPLAAQMFGGEPNATLELVADHASYAPGSPARFAARATIEPGWHVNSRTPTFEWLIPTELRLELPAGWPEARIDYPPHAMKTFAFEDEPLAVYDGEVVILASLVVPESVAQDQVRIAAVLAYQACDDAQCLPPTTARAELAVAIGELGAPAADAALFAAPRSGGSPGAGPREGEAETEAEGAGLLAGAAGGGPGLFAMLLLGVLGGLILNAMPCVLPVLSLKVFGLVKSAGQGRSHVVGGALATAAGIVLSFWGLAAAAVAARAAGAAVGWGIQFQNPVFVTFLLVVVVLFCLNLWGLFEIRLPGFVARAAGGGGGGGESVAGHLATGLFATLMATPCSAPFLGTALAFALAQPAGTIFAIFTAVGLGMALPYLVLAAAPGTARLLPRPGAWMATLRKAMGFLLAGAAVWLLYVLGSQVSLERRAWIELAMLGIALLVWLRHRAGAGSGVRLVRRSAGVGVALLVLAALGIGWRAGEAQASPDGEAAGLIAWQEFDRARAEALAAEGRLVFVDVTADWCFTCKVNERLVLETEPVAAAFARHGVVPMKADWTNRDDGIAAFLEDHGRYGIPFYLLYRPGAEPHVFSELISKDGVIRVLEEAAG